jgi:hypothetical protein
LTFAALPATTITSTLPTQALDALLHFPLPLSFPAAPYPISQPVTFFPFQISTSPPYSFTTITNSITSLHGKITIPFCHCNSTMATFNCSSHFTQQFQPHHREDPITNPFTKPPTSHLCPHPIFHIQSSIHHFNHHKPKPVPTLISLHHGSHLQFIITSHQFITNPSIQCVL